MIAGRLAVLILVGAMALPATSLAQTPPLTVGYTGLVTREGNPVDNTFPVEARLYNRARGPEDEPELWAEEHPDVRIRQGVIALTLGVDEPLTDEILNAGPLYLQIFVNDMLAGPRVPFEAVPFARIAERARTAEYPNGVFVGESQLIDETGLWLGTSRNDDGECVGTETLESIGCERDQAPFRGGACWACLNVGGDDSSFAIAPSACGDEDEVVAAIDNRGEVVCEDMSDFVTQAQLAEDGYVTQDVVDAQMFFSADNAPSWMTDIANIPAGFADGMDADTRFSGEPPVSIDGNGNLSLSSSGCSSNAPLVWDDSGGEWECGSLFSLGCSVVSTPVTAAGQQFEAICTSGTVTGGGFDLTDGSNDFFWVTAEARPNDAGTGWVCSKSHAAGGNCYAVCC